MAKITFCYGAEGIRTADMRVIIGDQRILLKDGESAETEVAPGEYEILFKGSIRFTRLNVNADRDMKIQIGWDRETGGVTASVAN